MIRGLWRMADIVKIRLTGSEIGVLQVKLQEERIGLRMQLDISGQQTRIWLLVACGIGESWQNTGKDVGIQLALG